MYSTNGEEQQEGDLQTLFCHLFVPSDADPIWVAIRTSFDTTKSIPRVFPSTEQFISGSKLSSPRGIDIEIVKPKPRNAIA
jgi:hypothetical protein